MSDVNLRYLLPDVVMESFYDMRNSQPPKDRLHYLDVVLEGSVESNATLLQKLYTDIISKSNIDYGQIPDSQDKAYHVTELLTPGQQQAYLLQWPL